MPLPALLAGLSPLLMSLVRPVVSRVLTALGVGLVTYTGFSAVGGQVKSYFDSAFGGLPADVSALVFMSGIPEGIGIILSAMAARIAMTTMTKFQFLGR